MKAALSHDLFQVETGQTPGYGGSQSLYENPKERASGGGIAAAASVILYMEALESGIFTVSKERFLEKSGELKKYMPIIPRLGVNSFVLAYGLSRYFKSHRLPFRAHWKCTAFRKWKAVEKMLRNDIPVILAIGLNFPKVWGKREVNLYVKDADSGKKGEAILKKDYSVCGHFVVITAMQGNILTVSTWGRKYYIKIDEFKAYVMKYSTHLYSNVLVIRKV